MIDLHTHILPNMDDGARDVEQSKNMLLRQKKQNVDVVALTPHFYRREETVQEFLQRREQSMEQLQPVLEEGLPDLILGAEVAWYPSLSEEKALESLCYDGTGTILLELPYTLWPVRMAEWLYRFVNDTGLTPILAHVERYFLLQSKSQMEDLLQLNLPMQMTADVFKSVWGRGKYLRMIKTSQWCIASDCHDALKRPPCMDIAVAYLRGKVSPEKYQELFEWPL